MSGERPPHILILTHELDEFDGAGYYLQGLAKIWRARGLQVTVQVGLGSRIEADLLILHVDLTVVPGNYCAYARQYPMVLNGGTTDISKRSISRQQVKREGDYGGPVVVKTDLNCNGEREVAYARRTAPWRRLAGRILHRLRGRGRRGEYRVFDSPREMPSWVWTDPGLIVERFMPERSGDEYVTRTYHFLGDREICNAVYSREPIQRPGNILRRIPTTEIPEGLRRRRAELGFDFGKFDYVVIGGEVIVFDANRTPTIGDVSPDILQERFQRLESGIDAFLAPR